MPLGQVGLVVAGRNATNGWVLDEAADGGVVTQVSPAQDRAEQA